MYFWYEMPACAARLRTAFNGGSENRRLTCHRRHQEIVLPQEVFDPFGAEPVLLAIPPVSVVPFKAGKREFHEGMSIDVFL